jgi:anti-sigma factor RsiW
MNHDDAMEMMAAERYILGELEPAERDAFEEHYFECSVCADDVRDSAKFAAGVRTSDAKVNVARFNWWAAAASIFAALLGYQSLVVVPQMRMAMHTQTPAAAVMRLADAHVLEPQLRGTSEPIKVRRDEPVLFNVAIPNNDPHAVYVCEFRDAASHSLASVSVPREAANEPVPLVVAPGVLSSGNYKLVIRGGDREIAAYPFTMEVR